MGKLIVALGSAIALFLLILSPQLAAEGASIGLQQCIRTVVPSLFPFFFLSGILCRVVSGIRFPPLRVICKRLGIPSGCEAILALGFLGGYPVGAQSVVTAWEERRITTQTARRMLGFCSNAGPSFIFGIAGTYFTSSLIPWVIWGIHIVSALLVGLLLPGKETIAGKTIETKCKHFSVTDILKSSVRTTALVCGWIILFRTLIHYLNIVVLSPLTPVVQVTLAGLLELANGCMALGNIIGEGERFVLCSTMLAFGGLCVMLQTCSVTEKLGTGYYFPGKMLHALLSLIISSIVSAFLFPYGLKILWRPALLATCAVPITMLFIRKTRNKGGNCTECGV